MYTVKIMMYSKSRQFSTKVNVMTSLGPYEHLFLEAIDTILATTTTKHRNFLVHACTSSENSFGTEKMPALLSSIDKKYGNYSKEDIRLVKLMLLYQKIKNDGSLSYAQNTHRNAQLAYIDLLQHTPLSDQDMYIVYGGIVSTIVTYSSKAEEPESVRLFLKLHEEEPSLIKLAGNWKKYFIDPIHCMFEERAYIG